MKTFIKTKFAILLIVNIILLNYVYSQATWRFLGKAGFSPDARLTAMCLDSKGMPYVVFQEYNSSLLPNSLEVTVMRYNGSEWDTVGKRKFSPGSANNPGIAMGKNDTPYVVFGDGANKSQPKVMKFNGTDWVTVGDLSSIIGAMYTSIAMDKNGMPYIGFNEITDSSKATVMRYDGNSWVVVGNRRFSNGSAGEPKLVLGQNDTPFMVYQDGGNGNKITVMKFDGLNWNPVGNAGFSIGSVVHPSIAINSKGQAMVAYMDISNGEKVTIMEFKGGVWNKIGSELEQSFEVSLAFGKNDTPYLAYKPTASKKANLVKFDGNSWINVGTNDFSPGKVSYLSVVLDQNDKPYVVFLDGTFTTEIGRISVMTYDNLTSIKTFPGIRNYLLLYPNPAIDFVQVSFDSEENLIGTISIYNHLGQIVKNLTIQINSGVTNYLLDIDDIASGIYLLKIHNGMQIRTAKLIVK